MLIVSRQEWGARPPKSRNTFVLPKRDVWLHHTAGSEPDGAAGIRQIQRFHQDSRGWADVGYCADADTEILTSDGWKRHDDLAEGDVVMTIDPATSLAEWQPLEAVHRFSGSWDLVAFEGHGHSSRTTTNHRWFVTHRGETMFRRTEELSGHDRIPCAAPCSNLPNEPKYADALVELLAWFWTEGECRGRGVVVYQSHVVNMPHVMRIRACLSVLCGPASDTLRGGTEPRWREVRRGHKTEFFISKELGDVIQDLAPNKVVRPSFLMALTAAQLELFIETSIDGDGWRNRTLTAISQRKRERLDSFQMACSLAGRRTVLRYDSSIDMWHLHLNRHQFVRPVAAARMTGKATKNIEQYKGIVWCPQTPNGTWLARRDGKVYFTGNSFLIDRTGVIFEGRGAGVVGAHTQGRNSTSHAICIVGNYESVHHPTEESLNAVAWLLRHGVTEGWWPSAALAGGHRDVASTACPGKNLYPKIGAINELAKGDDMPSLDEIRAVVREEVNAKVVASEWQFHKPRYSEILKAIKAVASGSADAEAIVDEIAERLARQGPDA